MSRVADLTYTCALCAKTHTAAEDNPLALLKLCKVCGEKRYRKGKAEQRRALASMGAATTTGETSQ